MADPNLTPGTDGGEDTNLGGGEGGNAPAGEGGGNQPTPVTEFEIDGQKYSADQLKEAIKAAGDYQHLVPEFTKKSQLLSKLGVNTPEDIDKKMKEIDEAAKGGGKSEDPKVTEARKILREQLGVVTKEDIQSVFDFIASMKSAEEDRQLQEAAGALSSKYDGSHGEPKFDVVAIANSVKAKPELAVYVQVDGQYFVDLEQTYRRVYAEYFDKVSGFKAKPIKTERGAGHQTVSQPVKKEAETEGEKIQSAVDFFKEAAKSQQE